MTQDEIVAMARDSGMELYGLGKNRARFVYHLEAFANLVAAKKQERIIEVVERLGTWAHITEVVDEIRGEA